MSSYYNSNTPNHKIYTLGIGRFIMEMCWELYLNFRHVSADIIINCFLCQLCVEQASKTI